MASRRMSTKGESDDVVALPEPDRRVSLTGYTNIVFDGSDEKIEEKKEDTGKLRVRFSETPSVGLGLAGLQQPTKRKYSVALQVLKPFRPSSKDGKLPVNSAGFFSFILLSWMSPLIYKLVKNRKRAIQESDIWQCSEQEGCEVNAERLSQLWETEARKGPDKASFKRACVRFIFTRHIISMLLQTMYAISSFIGAAFLVNWIIQYMESEESDLWYGLGLCLAMLASDTVRSVSNVVTMVHAQQTGTRLRAACMGLVYKKILRMRTIKGKTSAEILNTFGGDSYRLFMFCLSFPYLCAIPVYLIIAGVYLYILIGLWCFVAMGTFTILYFIQTAVSRVLGRLRQYTVAQNDIRVRRMNEVLSNIKFIKMYAWEEPFTAAIKAIRRVEQRFLLKSNLVNAINVAVIPCSPAISSIVVLSAYVATGNKLVASTAFAVTATLEFLRIIVVLIPMCLRNNEEAQVTFDRLQKLLEIDEHIAPSEDVYDAKNVIEIGNASFIWEELTSAPETGKGRKYSLRKESVNLFSLRDVNLNIKQGQLLGICGQVGSGKSSLVSALLGRMKLIKGHLAVKGRVAYVSQQATVFNASLKDNILFGKEYDDDKFHKVLECCGLEPDIKILPDGVDSEIGERGANLSGGQKQRVNLARAVYSDSDIYLLDDPLSALDVRVGKNIFHKCIRQHLNGKTVILVTHQLQFLRYCDEVAVMKEGDITERGKHDDLLASGETYTEIMNIYNKTTMKPTKSSSRDGEPNETDNKPKSPTIAAKNGLAPHVANGSAPTQKKKKGQIVVAEDMAVGAISLKTYDAYIRAGGGYFVMLIVLILFLLYGCASAFNIVWLRIWIDSEITTSTNKTVYIAVNMSAASATNESVTDTTHSISSIFDVYLIVYMSSLLAVIGATLAAACANAKQMVLAASRLHAGCLNKIMKAPMAFFDANPSGRILNRFSKDLDEVDVYLPQATAFLLMVTFQILTSIVISVYTSYWIAIGLVPLCGVLILLKKLATTTIPQIKRLENVSRSPLLAHVNSTSNGLSTIVTYGQQQRFYKDCTSMGDVSCMTTFLVEMCNRWINLRADLMSTAVNVSICVIFILSKGIVTAASAGMVLNLMGKNLDSEKQTADKMPSPTWPDKGSVTFKNVSMKYRKDLAPVLKNITFEMRPKEHVGIVGRTGAGKSSLAAALFRLVELNEGSIHIDGECISSLHLNAIRSKISTITQDPVLFAETIRYNLDPFGQYSDDDIWKALERVHMKEKIDQQDDRLESQVDENGENFSVGERQLLCLARVLLRRSKILLLDEATANIDTSTDALIQTTLREAFSECTVITIAHRLNTVLHSDKIIVLDAGRVMEVGSPQELLSDPRSFFNAMITSQTVKTPSPLPVDTKFAF